MFARFLQVSPRRFRPALRNAGVSAGVISLTLLCGCQDRNITLTDFSKTFTLAPPDSGAPVVGLTLETELDASAPIQLQVGCKGAVDTRLTIPNHRTYRQRIDWYSDCAELSFSTGGARARSITVSYRFQTL